MMQRDQTIVQLRCILQIANEPKTLPAVNPVQSAKTRIDWALPQAEMIHKTYCAGFH